MGERILNLKLFDKYNKKILLSEKHLDKVYDTVVSLKNTIEAAFSNNMNAYRKNLRNLNLSEREADRIHEKIVLALTETSLDPADREDLLEFNKLTDLIADWSRDGGRMLNIFINDVPKIHNKLKKGILKMVNTLEKEVKLLKICLELLKKNTKERAIKTTLKVSEIEQTVDQLNLYNLSLLKELEGIPVASMILIRDFINCIEQAADYTQYSSDLIRAIAIKKI
ncbi:MAG: DUF47 domain-containing protein [Candidatus Odinarchaeia archaeon]